MNTVYDESIAEYLGLRENIRYTLDIVDHYDSMKKTLRTKFWNTLLRIVSKYIASNKELVPRLEVGRGLKATDEYLFVETANPQKFALRYGWEIEGGVITFGIYYSHDRFENGRDLLAEVKGLAELSGRLKDLLPSQEAGNAWTLCWKTGLGNVEIREGLIGIADDVDAYASCMLEEFKAVYEQFGPDIKAMNQILAEQGMPAAGPE